MSPMISRPCTVTLRNPCLSSHSNKESDVFFIPQCKSCPNDLSISCQRIPKLFLHFQIVPRSANRWSTGHIGTQLALKRYRIRFPRRTCEVVMNSLIGNVATFEYFLFVTRFHKNRLVAHGSSWKLQDSLDTINTPQNSTFNICRTSKKSIFRWQEVE